MASLHIPTLCEAFKESFGTPFKAIFRHPVILCITLGFCSYFIYFLWERGAFAFTVDQKIAWLVRHMKYYKGRPEHLIPFSGRDADQSIVPLAKKLGDAAVPALAEEVRAERYGDDSATFLLGEVIGTKLALEALVEAGHDGFTNNFVLWKAGYILGAAALEAGPHTRGASGIYEWYNHYKDRIVETDYGLGLRMPDDTIRPLGRYGMVIRREKFHNDATKLFTDYFFCTERRIVYERRDGGPVIRDSLERIAHDDGVPEHEPQDHASIDWDQEERELFSRLFTGRIQSDPVFWPYYPVLFSGDNVIVKGYFDAEHRRHGLWRDIDGETEAVTGERWFFHGEELPESEYFAKGGYDMAISLPPTPE